MTPTFVVHPLRAACPQASGWSPHPGMDRIRSGCGVRRPSFGRRMECFTMRAFDVVFEIPGPALRVGDELELTAPGRGEVHPPLPEVRSDAGRGVTEHGHAAMA